MEIFCPNNHLILDAQSCKTCSWQRPIGGQVGKLFWGPVDLQAGLGGESREKFASMCTVGDILITALRSNELVGLSLSSGYIKWRSALPLGKQVNVLLNNGEKAYLVMLDTHSLMESASCGCIYQIDPQNGQLTGFWQAPSHDLTPPVFWKDRVLVRTAESKLYALQADDPNKEFWKISLQTWWASPLLICDNKVLLLDGNAMFNESNLLAVEALDGQLSWHRPLSGMPIKKLVASDQMVYVIDNKKDLQCRNIMNGEIEWHKEFLLVYSAPVVCGGLVLIVVRGNRNAQAPDHYLLVALKAETGKIHWQIGLPSKVLIPPYCVDETVLLADVDGKLSARKMHNGEESWSFVLGHDEDSIQTNPLVTGDMVVIGSYFGKLAAISIRQPLAVLKSPESYLEQNQYKLAAEAYALNSDYFHAAQIYEKKLQEHGKAIQLYEIGNNFQNAADLSFAKKNYSAALEYYRKAGDRLGEAKTLLVMGGDEEAYQIFVETKAYEIGAAAMEAQGHNKWAAKLFLLAGSVKDYERLITQTSWDASEVEILRREGKHLLAALWNMENHMYLEASKDYRHEEKFSEEFDALRKHWTEKQNQVEKSALQRIAELGEILGDEYCAASAWKELKRFKYAGDAYRKVAEKLERQISESGDQMADGKKAEIARMYELAADAYKQEGSEQEELQCLYLWRKYKEIPFVIVPQGTTRVGFKEDEFNTLVLEFINIGFGRAIDVTVKLAADLFEVDANSRTIKFNLSAENSVTKPIILRPLIGQHGATVPLGLTWSWKADADERTFQQSWSIPVKVVSLQEAHSTDTTIYQIQNVENLVKGDQHRGDNLSVVRENASMNRSKTPDKTDSDKGSTLRISLTEDHEGSNKKIICQVCGRANSFEAIHCNGCGTKLDRSQ